jgi:hypothetical protein
MPTCSPSQAFGTWTCLTMQQLWSLWRRGRCVHGVWWRLVWGRPRVPEFPPPPTTTHHHQTATTDDDNQHDHRHANRHTPLLTPCCPGVLHREAGGRSPCVCRAPRGFATDPPVRLSRPGAASGSAGCVAILPVRVTRHPCSLAPCCYTRQGYWWWWRWWHLGMTGSSTPQQLLPTPPPLSTAPAPPRQPSCGHPGSRQLCLH